MLRTTIWGRRGRPRSLVTAITAVAAVLAVLTSSWSPAAAAEPGAGDAVYISDVREGYPGTALHGIFITTPSDPDDPGTPDYWAYCIEHDISAESGLSETVHDASDFLGGNFFTDPTIQGKVLWVLAHSYPRMSLADFGDASGVSGISVNDAVEATQYAIWRYTDLDFDASWNFETDDSEDAYWYLVNGANSSSGMTPADFETTVGITGPSTVQSAGSLAGPFTISTNQATVAVSVDPAYTVTDATGTPVDASAVTDGQQIYLDLRGHPAAGSATLTASAAGSSLTGKIISVPTQPDGTPDEDDHAQTVILVAPSTAAVTDSAPVSWTAAATPTIGTTLVDAADGDHVLNSSGGTVIDTIAYQNLVAGTEYQVNGELMLASDGSATGITGSATFTPSSADGTIAVTFTIPLGYDGKDLIAFETLTRAGATVAEHKDLHDAAQTVTVSPKTPTTTPTTPTTPTATGSTGRSHPRITTRSSASKVLVRHPIRDVVTISGFTSGGDATGTARLYGPSTSHAAATCTKATLAGTVTFTPRNGTLRTPAVTVTEPGYYTWVAATSADAYNTAASHRCGLTAETTLVHKPSYGAPVVNTGFSGVEARLRTSAPARLRYPGVGVSAPANAVAVRKGAVQVPSTISQLGLLTPSAGLGDAIGTTVVAGHVSDHHDSPGAFYRLTKAKKGQVVKVTQAGHTYRFRVTRIKTYSRAHGGHPPASAFSTTGAHKLVLISCADKVVRPDGHFHYTRNIVVTATPLR